MLILSRKIGEKIVIGEDIEVLITSINRGVVRVGITAPRNVPIFRYELLLAKLADQQKEREVNHADDRKTDGDGKDGGERA
jgi:carbon storage regulator